MCMYCFTERVHSPPPPYKFLRSVVEGEEILARYDLPEGVELITLESWYECMPTKCLNK
jgi:hypothetical protein